MNITSCVLSNYSWSVWIKLKETIDSFKQTLPLTIDLRNPALRQRHWEKLIDHVGQFFDPNSSSFTLAKVSACIEKPKCFFGRVQEWVTELELSKDIELVNI
jgi:hypothetical protein